MSLVKDLGLLVFYFERGRKTYECYRSDGSIYLYAKILKENNQGIKKALARSFVHMPADVRQDALAIVHHIDVWMMHWMALENDLNPLLGDRFVFENPVRYPGDAEQRIVRFYEELVS
jgi:hypothetical protein